MNTDNIEIIIFLEIKKVEIYKKVEKHGNSNGSLFLTLIYQKV